MFFCLCDFCQVFWSFEVVKYKCDIGHEFILPETNVAPESLGLEDWGPAYFQVRAVSFREGTSMLNPLCSNPPFCSRGFGVGCFGYLNTEPNRGPFGAPGNDPWGILTLDPHLLPSYPTKWIFSRWFEGIPRLKSRLQRDCNETGRLFSIWYGWWFARNPVNSPVGRYFIRYLGESTDDGAVHVSSHTVGGTNPANQLRLVVYPIICRVLAPSKRWKSCRRISESSTVSTCINYDRRILHCRKCLNHGMVFFVNQPYVPWSKVAFYRGWETSHLLMTESL